MHAAHEIARPGSLVVSFTSSCVSPPFVRAGMVFFGEIGLFSVELDGETFPYDEPCGRTQRTEMTS